MKRAVEALFQGRPPLAGLAAWCVVQPDGATFSHCHTDWFKPAQVERALQRMTTGVQNLRGLEMQPDLWCWVFDRTRIYMTLRPDGAALALFAENRPGLPVTEIDAVLQEFRSLPAAAAESTRSSG